MKSHSCSEVRIVVAREYTHSNCDYLPSKVMPSMEPMGQFNHRPLLILVHGFTLSRGPRLGPTLETRDLNQGPANMVSLSKIRSNKF